MWCLEINLDLKMCEVLDMDLISYLYLSCRPAASYHPNKRPSIHEVDVRAYKNLKSKPYEIVGDIPSMVNGFSRLIHDRNETEPALQIYRGSTLTLKKTWSRPDCRCDLP
ncbi:unnamed protein product [Dovyalis caffra]|uniref:Uncharacterized protein n=1 Tax=Dovyalis caffra TaxID=77055 RepID=A0AAV1SPF4_9ROSI|nr:unnamed protein product [Dovyalis caffra]